MKRNLLILLLALAVPPTPAARMAVAAQSAGQTQDAVGAGEETETADDAVGGVDGAVDAAMAGGVAYLISRQNPDGSISPGPTHATALTSLAVLAMLGSGHLPTDPSREGDALRKALAFILADGRQEDNGYFGRRDGSRMYGHGITTLMLSEILGMGTDAQQDALIRAKLKKAIDLILRSQQVEKTDVYDGGWRYTPTSADSDLSITVWQVMALRSALEAGLDVPAAAIDEAVDYLQRSFAPLASDATMGQFSYLPGRGYGYSTTAAGLLAMQVCGRYDAPEVAKSAKWLMSRPLDASEQWFYYGTYYYAQGLNQRGGDVARTAQQRVETALLALQHNDGSWSGEAAAQERVYATSMALLSLSVRYHFLPIYQR